MLDKKFKGVFTALLTPYDENGAINFNSLEKLIEFNIENGIDGFYVCGSTGEGLLLSIEERKSIYEFVAKVNAGRVTLIAHVGTINTLDACDMAKCADNCGFDAVSAVSPYYYAFGYDAIVNYYKDIASASSLPVILYNFSAIAGGTFTVERVSELFNDKRFIGIKHTSNDLYSLERFKNKLDDVVVYNGYDEMLLAGLSMGADGGIGSTYNFMPKLIKSIYNAFMAGDLKLAQSLQAKANSYIDILIKHGVFACEKQILTEMGIPMGDCRKPFMPITEEGKLACKKIAEELKNN